jgi:hypothetical protein
VRNDPRTQAKVARNIFGHVLTGVAVAYPSMVILVGLYHGTLSHAGLCSAASLSSMLHQ